MLWRPRLSHPKYSGEGPDADGDDFDGVEHNHDKNDTEKQEQTEENDAFYDKRNNLGNLGWIHNGCKGTMQDTDDVDVELGSDARSSLYCSMEKLRLECVGQCSNVHQNDQDMYSGKCVWR